MGFFQLYQQQILPATVDEAWEFISKPGNLKLITPKYMGFDITSGNGNEKMHPGMVISYRVSPLFGIKTIWVTEITHVSEKLYFVDEQRVGPYSLWHHQHKLKPVKGGVLMTDIVSYKPPFGILGNIVNKLIIKNKLNEIFDFRQKKLEEIFGTI